MDYNLALEKAVLEYAADVFAHPERRNGAIRIPGFLDAHVWGMSVQLFEKDYITASTAGDDGQVHVTEISERGATRLEEILARERQLLETKMIQMAATSAKQKKRWWRRTRAS